MRKTIIIGLIGLFLILTGCAQDLAFIERGNISAARKVLIAGTSSEFKQDVITKVIEKLGTQDYYFKIIGSTQLEKEEIEQFGVILLVTAIMAGQMDKQVKQFLEKHPTDSRVIILYTCGVEDPTPVRAISGIKVDAVTSASLSERVDKRVDQLAALIEKKF